jgi:hypothetical protein
VCDGHTLSCRQLRETRCEQVLQDALCGSSKVLLVCNVAPEPASAAETICSLNFASRAAKVRLVICASRAANGRSLHMSIVLDFE